MIGALSPIHCVAAGLMFWVLLAAWLVFGPAGIVALIGAFEGYLWLSVAQARAEARGP